jgi:hypothetical protein
MVYLPEDRGKVIGDGTALVFSELTPDVARVDGHASSLSPAQARKSVTASRVSLVAMPLRPGRRLVAGIGILNSMVLRYITRTKPRACAEVLTETTGNRRPNKGWVGSVTTISSGDDASRFWKGASRLVLVRQYRDESAYASSS